MAALAMFAVAFVGGANATAAQGGGLPGPNDRPFDPASDTERNSCVSPGGIDLNVLYGISEQMVTFFCTQVDAGEHWTAPGPPWVMNTSFESAPEGFVPVDATPLDDFLAKFVAVSFVIDAGTRQERTLVYLAGDRIWTGSFDGLPAVNAGTLSIASPLRIGTHVVEVYWVMNAMHCDGLGAVVEENCLPAGEVPFISVSFEVTPAAAQS